MIVELVGPPGSGKTFLAPSVAIEHNITVLHVQGRVEKCLLGIGFILRHPFLSTRLFMIFFRETDSFRLLIYKLWIVLFEAMAKDMKVQIIGRGVVDEGLLQALCFGLYDRKVNEEMFMNVLRLLSHRWGNRNIIFVTAPLEERANRMIKRGRVPRARLGVEYVQSARTTTALNELAVRNAVLSAFNRTSVMETGLKHLAHDA